MEYLWDVCLMGETWEPSKISNTLPETGQLRYINIFMYF